MRQPERAVISKGSAEHFCSLWAPVPGDPRNVLWLEYRCVCGWGIMGAEAIETGHDQNLEHKECQAESMMSYWSF